jgi:hypothetical protein
VSHCAADRRVHQRKVLGELPYIEFRQVQSGAEETTYSNEHQGIPVKLVHVINNVSRKASFNIEMLFPDQNVANIRDFLRMRQALSQATYLKVVELSTQQSLELNISGQPTPKVESGLINLFEDLSRFKSAGMSLWCSLERSRPLISTNGRNKSLLICELF